MPDYVGEEEMNKYCPQMVIKFYEIRTDRNSLRVVDLKDVEIVDEIVY